MLSMQYPGRGGLHFPFLCLELSVPQHWTQAASKAQGTPTWNPSTILTPSPSCPAPPPAHPNGAWHATHTSCLHDWDQAVLRLFWGWGWVVGCFLKRESLLALPECHRPRAAISQPPCCAFPKSPSFSVSPSPDNSSSSFHLYQGKNLAQPSITSHLELYMGLLSALQIPCCTPFPAGVFQAPLPFSSPHPPISLQCFCPDWCSYFHGSAYALGSPTMLLSPCLKYSVPLPPAFSTAHVST